MSNPFCEPCGHEHGPLYICPRYSDERKADLRAKSEKLKADLQDPKYVQEHIDRGVPLSALRIMGMFCGVEVPDPSGGEGT